MAPVPFEHPIRYAPLAAAGAHAFLAVYLTYAVGASLYTSYKSLGPSQDTRARLAQRKRLIPVFSALASVAALIAAYTSFSSASLSYRVWAYEHGLDYYSQSESTSQLYIAQWLSDVSTFYDSLEIVSEKARRFWWSQQIDLATSAWSVLLAVEGRRRNIPLLTAFLALAHLVNLSFAQSLFYLALLLTPAPLPTGDEGLELPVAPVPTSRWTSLRDKILPPKPPHWHPHPAVFYSALVLNLGSTLTLPYAAGTSSFLATTLLARGSTFLPLLLPRMAPASWGKVDVHPHARYESLTHIFRFVSAASFLLHLKATFAGLAYNAPASHYHRHSSLLPWDVEERDTWERTNTAVGKVLGSIKDHPAVMAVGLDVLLCALSLGVWAAVRPTSIEGIIKAAVPFHRQAKSAETDKRLLDEISRALSPALTTSEGVEAEAKPRKRGRPRKTPLPEADVKSEQGHGGEDEAYEPTKAEEKQTVEGDRQSTAGAETGQAEDYEAAALAWGISAVAGLASASAGVFGGECMSR